MVDSRLHGNDNIFQPYRLYKFFLDLQILVSYSPTYVQSPSLSSHAHTHYRRIVRGILLFFRPEHCECFVHHQWERNYLNHTHFRIWK